MGGVGRVGWDQGGCEQIIELKFLRKFKKKNWGGGGFGGGGVRLVGGRSGYVNEELNFL